jgi:hypothetical protein
MSITRHHAEWLSLVEVSGPFLSMPILERVFPQGIDDIAPEIRNRMRLGHEEWLEATAGPPDVALHNAWIGIVVREVLGYDRGDFIQDHPNLRVTAPEHHESISPTFAIRNPDGREGAGQPRVLVTVLDPGQDPDRALAGAAWKAAPIDRMVLLLRGVQSTGTGCRLGIVTNGASWVLVHVAPNEPTTYVRWSSELWFDEPLTFRAFVSLLGARRLFGVADDDTLEALFAQSAKDAQDVTEKLGQQVRRAVEVLVQTIDRVDRERNGKLLDGVPTVTIYEASVSVMMRLIFLLAAEERKLLLLGAQLYDQHYAVSNLYDQLQAAADRHGEEVLERRHDAWSRLLAMFRAVFGGIDHVDLRMPAYGGSLFDPDRFPLLEGRRPDTSWRDPVQASVPPLAVDNRTVLHLLRAITRLEMKAGGGHTESRRLSFRALDVEQIGHVYEGLLDHTAKRAVDITLSLTGKLEPEIPVLELERRRRKDKDDFIAWVAEATGRSTSAVESALAYPMPKEDERRWLRACENVRAVYERVSPWAGLVRNDTHGDPVVIPKGAVYVTEGADRRSTGTHYTPRTLTEPIVQYTLEPLVYEGPAEGKPREEWRLRSAKEILALRVCDLAMGSAAFLVQACRFLSQRLVEAWEAEEKRLGTRLVLAPNGGLSSGEGREQLVPIEAEERLVLARRYVADRCLYGVDVNPWAVEIGKLSLWLTTLQKGRPFSFVDHSVREGDSLLGITSEEQLVYFHLDPKRGRKLHDNLLDVAPRIRRALARARAAREKLEDFATNDIADARHKAWLLREATEATGDLRLVGDAIIGAALASAKNGADAFDDVLKGLSVGVVHLLDATADSERRARREKLRLAAAELLQGGRLEGQPLRRAFHWAIEFPEVMARGGFDAFIGNPPFRGGKLISGILGTDYREHLVEHLASGRKGHADLCAYFFLRAASLVRTPGGAGLVATNTIAQGDTREVGLDSLLQAGSTIHRAISSRPWPGTANLEVAHVWTWAGAWRGDVVLNERSVQAIESHLTVPQDGIGSPHRLSANANKSFQGTVVLGTGFMLDPAEADALRRANKKNKKVLFPYLGGEDVTGDADQLPSRWVINFRDWPLDGRTAPSGYSGELAADYPECLDIVRKRVRPERAKSKRRQYREKWWMFAERQPALQRAIEPLQRVLVTVLHSKYLTIAEVDKACIFSHALAVFALPPKGYYACLQSNIHEAWARAYGSTLETRLRYTGSDCFDTFPFPTAEGPRWRDVEQAGIDYDAQRRALMRATGQGTTKTYNRYHDAADKDPRLEMLRTLHASMDEAVMAAYGWSDMKLGHDFHHTKEGIRFTFSEGARAETLVRLLQLNHQRYADESAEPGRDRVESVARRRSTADSQSARRSRGAAAPSAQQSLFAGEDE